ASGGGPEREEQVTLLDSITHCFVSVGTPVAVVEPEGGRTMVEKGDAAQKQPDKAKRKKLLK
ncbi:hypothetical protein Tco_0571905, partial [Tanacetum coccineum]